MKMYYALLQDDGTFSDPVKVDGVIEATINKEAIENYHPMFETKDILIEEIQFTIKFDEEDSD